MTDNTHTFSTQFNKDGKEESNIPMCGEGGPEAQCYISPRKAIPIVFVPGIMGSPLIAPNNSSPINLLDSKWAWFPDSKNWLGGTIPKGLLTAFIYGTGLKRLVRYSNCVQGFSFLSAEKRSLMLKPWNTRVPNVLEADLDFANLDGALYDKEELIQRGWGTIILGDFGYGSFLCYLDNVLNKSYEKGKKTKHWENILNAIKDKIVNENDNDFIQVKGSESSSLTEENILSANDYYYPVYAAGYNWLESNDTSAKEIAAKIDEILIDCNERLGMDGDKVILVTHSMGGLVGRMCAKKYSEKIMGVVHGVQPINGAASAYHRAISGWDGKTGLVLGTNNEELLPILSTAGALQLLPNKNYGNNWLSVYKMDGDQFSLKENEMFSLPNKNPYEELYLDFNSWWRMVNQKYIMPEEKDIDIGTQFYIKNIQAAEIFHDELSEFFHSNTYLYYGKSENNKTWYKVDICIGLYSRNVFLACRNNAEASSNTYIKSDSKKSTDINSSYDGRLRELSKDDVMSAKLDSEFGYTNNMGGISTIYNKNYGNGYNVFLVEAADRGDGTVPAASMRFDTSSIKSILEIDNIEHNLSYDSCLGRLFSIYAILRILSNYENNH